MIIDEKVMENRKAIKITDVSTMLKVVKSIHYSDAMGLKWLRPRIYYRGQAHDWELKPSLFRKEYGVSMEYQLLNNAQRTLWKEMQTYSTYLEKLIFLQHYGFPTRLLDVTTNPLVALFFACQPCKVNGRNRNGVIYVSCQDEENNADIEKLCKVLFEYELVDLSINNLEQVGLSSSYHKLVTNNLYITPPINNNRIEAQQGSFIFAKLFDLINGQYSSFANNTSDMFEDKKFIIPQSCKESILYELRELGISEGSMFPDIEHKIKSTQQFVKDKFPYLRD